MKNSEAFQQANERRGVRKHVAQYMTRSGKRIDERVVGYWGEGHPSPLDDLELLLNAYSLANPQGFQILAERIEEMIATIRTERELTLLNENQGTATLNREWSEFLQSRLKGKPRAIQRKELMDVVASFKNHLTVLEGSRFFCDR